ncbi:hypothetical protein IW261DRAFT_1511126 [Armillaria novae-zelandiae]|uniref:Uncharacterized protein n=1 Tax=Armillaria novae-zelandiae TaxID=153914 RepID=A0AA39NTP2_9AGAR|nr:hypothetical protein IW261DRAFT_1511126 [Armillaria novae-zelandiae]
MHNATSYAISSRDSPAVCRPRSCPPGYEKKQFTHKMAHKISQRHSIPYQDMYYYASVDQSYHRCPIADCLSVEETFRGDTIKAHLEYYHPNILTTKNIVCRRGSLMSCISGRNIPMLIRCVPSAVVGIGGLIIFAGILRNARNSDHVAYTYRSVFLPHFSAICFVINLSFIP